MKYGDLSSVVQLGVGLHVGTAVLQLYSELGMAPMERRLVRIRDLFKLPEGERPSAEISEELEMLEGRYGLFKIEFFSRYRWLVLVNTIVAVILAIFLAVIAYKNEDTITNGFEWFPIVCLALGYLPAPLVLGCLSFDAWLRLKPIKVAADNLEHRALSP